VTIRDNELSIIENAFKSGILKPNPPKKRTGKKVAVIGSGPCGIAVADQLNKMGHKVTLFEKDNKIGGILRYGIPDFKLEKHIIDRRLDILKQEGIVFRAGTAIVSALSVKNKYDATVLTIGSRKPRDLQIEGRDLKGVYFAMDYLMQSNRKVSKESFKEVHIDAKGKKVVVIGGGDTGSDCVGTANRQGAASVLQIEVMPQPPVCRTPDMPWPKYPMLFKTTTSHEEGADRHFAVLTKKMTGDEKGNVKMLHCVKVEFIYDEAKKCKVMKEISGTEYTIDADMVILAMGFLHPDHDGIVKDLKLKLDNRGNIQTDTNYMTSQKGIFAAGDCHRGQSLVVWAIYEGRQAAESVNTFLSA